MKNRKFITPTVKVVKFNEEDVIRTSGGGPTDLPIIWGDGNGNSGDGTETPIN